MVKIFVAEDNEELNKLYVERLREFGFHVAGYTNPVDMVEALKNNIYPDFIITDYQMPNINGVEVIEIVKKNPQKPYAL